MGIAAMLGSPIKRREDPRLITGQATYVDDIKLYGMLHMAVLRSAHVHARVASIEVNAAREHPAVRAVFTADDLPATLQPFPVIWSPELNVWGVFMDGVFIQL